METASKVLLISSENQKEIFQNDFSDAIAIVEEALIKKMSCKEPLPAKISMIFDKKSQSRINCMPAYLQEDGLCGVKWVSVFPENPKAGYRTVTGTMILTETKNGHTLAIMDAGYLTEVRTAAVGAVAAKYLAKKDVKTIGFIGAGQEARRHLDLLKVVRPNLKRCYVSSRTSKTVKDFIEEEQVLHPDMDFVFCGNNYESAVTDADIIVTAISEQQDILKSDWIKKGALYIHVAGWEDEYKVAKSASKIICDDWNGVKKRKQTLSRMYEEGLLDDSDIYANLEEIIFGNKSGRDNDEEFIYFCSVGLAIIDVSFAKYINEQCRRNNIGTPFVFGMY